MFDARTQACSPSAPLATLSWPHNVTIGGTEVERGRCLFVRNTVARNRERNERTLKGSVESSMATVIPAIEGGTAEFVRRFFRIDERFLTVRVLRPSQKHCHFSYKSGTHTQTRKHAPAHTQAREGEKEKKESLA